jgi:glutamate synthase domain-containing protein 2
VSGFISGFVQGANALLVFGLGALGAVAGTLAVIDRLQRKDVMRHNFPLAGRFMKQVDWLGRFWRSHGGAMDREQEPFNRAEQHLVHSLAAKKSGVTAFGSTDSDMHVGKHIFVNAQFPPLEKDVTHAHPVVIGPHCKKPYSAKSFFNISAMSYGALSPVAVRALSKGAKLADCWMNTGEGGLAPAHLEGDCDIVFQMGTAKYGVRDSEGKLDEEKLKKVAGHDQVKMIEVKLSQGAKPGKGGILPGSKVTAEIAAIRAIPEGRDSISPNRHVEIGSVSELLDFIHRVRTLTGKPTGFKTVISERDSIEELCLEIKKRGIEYAPDFITLDGGDGGTGAAPMVLMDNMGLPLRESLPMLTEALAKHGLKDRIRVVASGKLVTPESVAWALCAGADFINSARGFMFALGCIQSMRCDKNTCPTGITTSNPKLQQGLNPEDKATKVANYCLGMRDNVEMVAHSCGVHDPRDLRPKHVRIVQQNGLSLPMNEVFPHLKF